MNPSKVINFWFQEIDQKKWWVKNESFDSMIGERFAEYHSAAAAGELFQWRSTPQGRLAEILILDQFSRNMFRGTPKSFAFDGMALLLSQEAVRRGADRDMTRQEKLFTYMPHMHSESKAIHKEAVRLFSIPGMDGNLDFEMKHKKIIDQFGRYPHRNEILGRHSTSAELEFLKGPNSSF